MRLRSNYSRWDHCLRGGVVGAAVAFAVREGLPAASPLVRFLYGIAAGVAAYAAVNLLRDMLNVALIGKRLRVQAPRIYITEAVMGGLVGGALCWYFDTMQAAVVAAKFKNYATLFYTAAVFKVEDYVILPAVQQVGRDEPRRGDRRRAAFFQRIALRRHQLVDRGAPVQHQPGGADSAGPEKHGAAEKPFYPAGHRGNGRAGFPRAALGPVDGADHLFLPAHVA